MNAPVLLAQLAGSPAQTPSSPKNLKLEKPQNGQAVTVHLDGNTKLDFADVASEKLTFVRVGEKLIILFDNQSTVTVDPVFDSMGKPLTDLAFDMGSDRTLTGEQLMIVLRLEQGQKFTDTLRDELVNRNCRLPDFKRLSGYVIWEADFPRTASLKIKRHVLAEEIRERLDRQTALIAL